MSGRVYQTDGPTSRAQGVIRIGTRRSRLALTQSTQVAQEIAQATGADIALIPVTTHGDVSREPLSQLGGTGVFVSALREALADDRCDLAVHSYKDLPTAPCPGMTVGAVPRRADARDAWCSRGHIGFTAAPPGSRVGTGSPRRAAQLLARRPDLTVLDIRGNVDTRLQRLENDLDAVVLAAAGLMRVDREEAITELFPLEDAPTAPGQGALAVEVRTNDLSDGLLSHALTAIEDTPTRLVAGAERALLAALEAGCAAPVGASARITSDVLALRAVVYRTDGSDRLESERGVALDGAGPPEELATELGQAVAADLLARGAAELAGLGRGVDRG